MSTLTAANIATGIICSYYKHETNQFIFISKNNDAESPNDYHLNIYNNGNQTMLSPVPLSKIRNYPNDKDFDFGGLCSYADSQSSLYMSFEQTTATNTINTLIYQLQLDDATSTPTQFQKTSLDLVNTTVSSFVYTAGANNTSYLAFISTTRDHEYFLTLRDIDHPRYQTTKNISSNEPGLLAVGGTNSQTLYFIQNNGVDMYKLDTMQYNHTPIHTNMAFRDLKRGTTGHVFSTNNSTRDYISFYHSSNGQFDIFDIDSSLAKYIDASVNTNHILDINATTTANNTQTTDLKEPLSTRTRVPLEKRNHLGSVNHSENNSNKKRSETRSFLKYLSNKFYRKKGAAAADATLQKRGIETNTDNTQVSSDGVVRYYTHQFVPENDETLPQAALLIPTTTTTTTALTAPEEAPSTSGIPYNFAFFSDSTDPNHFTVTIEHSRSQTPLAETPTNTNANPNADATNDGQAISSASNLGGGAIAGIVISVVAFIAIIAGLLFYSKKRKEKIHTLHNNSRGIKPEMSSYDSSTPLSIQPKHFVTDRYSGVSTSAAVAAVATVATNDDNNRFSATGATSLNDNHSSTSSILLAAPFVPEEYHNDSRPDIRPLSYNEDGIDYAQLSQEELLQLEPDVSGPLFLFSGVYTSPEKEQVTYLQDGYALRTFNGNDGIKYTVHYFSASHLDTFVRSVHAVLRASPSSKSKRSSLVSPNYIIKSERAIILSSPTPHNHYQYIWITSPMIPEHSLHHLLFERTEWSFIDYRNTDYKIWSIYALLKAVETMHTHKLVHLAIDLKSFYFDHEMKATDWRLGNMGYACSTVSKLTRVRVVLPANHTQFTAPEIIQCKKDANQLQLESADIWSLGCVVYSVATGGLLLFQDVSEVRNLAVFQDDLKQHVKMQIRQHVESDVFQNILEKMLHVDPSDRKSIKSVLNYWNSIYNMEE